ncbi:MAG: helix-turn-helix domain-containing protein [Deltaproteobacteria bacterium]|jgi:transcriptional regulator with XRE-family HTH domain|nr:helix-turn-helix domain-containing protein [Deltaproteobacteria bacterium]
MTIGDRIRKLRDKEPRKSFCDRFNIAQSTLIRYETNEREPEPSLIVRICKHYNVSTDWLILGAGPALVENGHAQIVHSQGQPVQFAPNSDAWIWNLTVDEFDLIWDIYKRESEAKRGWVQFEVLKRFPEFFEWLKKEGPILFKQRSPLLSNTNICVEKIQKQENGDT